MISRRHLLAFSSLAPIPFLTDCSPSSTKGVDLAMVQAYATDLINALSVAAQTYVVQPHATSVATVNQIVGYLQQAKEAIQGVQVETDAKGVANEIISFANQLSPIVMPFLGAAAPYLPIAIAVLQSFIASLPAPPQAPPTPPAALHRVALTYHRHGA